MWAMVISALGGGLARLLSAEFAIWFLQRAFWVSLMGLVLPVILWNLAVEIQGTLLTWMAGKVQAGALSPVVLEVSGVAAWIAVKLKFVESVSLLLGALALRWTLSVATLGRL